MAVEIRRLTPEDWAAFRTIRLRSLHDAPEVYGTTLDQEADKPEAFWRESLADPANAIFCGFLDGEVVALAGLRDGAGGNVRHRGFVWGVFVAERCRGAGVGTALMRGLLDNADARPEIDFTELNVRADNASAARLYERLGYRSIGTIPRALKHAGRYGDELMMIRDRPNPIQPA